MAKRKSIMDTRGGLISRGKCEACKLDLGNRLDPYCWRCADQIARAYEARRKERLQEAAAEHARVRLDAMLRKLGVA
jgi:hypothetical protein